jgi:hypothetical protein
MMRFACKFIYYVREIAKFFKPFKSKEYFKYEKFKFVKPFINLNLFFKYILN